MTENNDFIQEERVGEEDANWYVLHTYSSYENKVKEKIQMLIENKQENIFDVKVPTEEVVVEKDGKKRVREKKLFPGYVLIKMNITPKSWYMIRNINGVTGFIGPGTEPVPLTEDEVRNFGVKKEATYDHIDIEVGDDIKINEGLFADMPAQVVEIDYEKATIKGIVSMFGRDTSVELKFSDIEKLD